MELAEILTNVVAADIRQRACSRWQIPCSLGLSLPKERESYNPTSFASRLPLDDRVTSTNDFFSCAELALKTHEGCDLRALVWRIGDHV